jgi:protein subunit release factor A
MSRVVLRISGRAVGDDATLIPKVLHMYSRYAESQGWGMEVNPSAESPSGPLTEVVAVISGENVYRKFKYENGVHRIQWVPPAEQQGRIFTSIVLVAVAPEGDELAATGVGAGAGKIRTYNFPQNRLTDHRIGVTWHELDLILDGKLDPVITALEARQGGAPEA